MRNSFEINGLFYNNKGCFCRKYLDIRRTELKVSKPDLMVVMMNPGSSKPEDGNDNNTIESKAVPDKTQEQIMKIMNSCKFNYVRVLNLSDLREAKSKVFYSKLDDLKNVPHSIFSNERLDDYNALFIKNIPVIFAWGVNKKLTQLAEMAIKRINEPKAIGLLKKGTSSAYYHPLPQNFHAQEQWHEDITIILKNHQDNLVSKIN